MEEIKQQITDFEARETELVGVVNAKSEELNSVRESIADLKQKLVEAENAPEEKVEAPETSEALEEPVVSEEAPKDESVETTGVIDSIESVVKTDEEKKNELEELYAKLKALLGK